MQLTFLPGWTWYIIWNDKASMHYPYILYIPYVRLEHLKSVVHYNLKSLCLHFSNFLKVKQFMKSRSDVRMHYVYSSLLTYVLTCSPAGDGKPTWNLTAVSNSNWANITWNHKLFDPETEFVVEYINSKHWAHGISAGSLMSAEVASSQRFTRSITQCLLYCN